METVTLNNKFYKKNVIQEAIRDFNEVCEARIKNENFDVELEKKDESVENLAEEFANYVLGLMKNEAAEPLEEKEETENHWTQNLHRVKKFGDKYLLTNDCGDWIFLDRQEYKLFSQDRSNEDEALEKKLLEKTV